MANPLIRKKERSKLIPVPNQSAGIFDDFAVRKNVATKEGTIEHTPTNDNHIANKKYVDDQFPVTHASTTGQTADDHHAQSHSVASHSDTSATGAELNTLTDNSVANALHRHSELVASDGSPDPALSVDAAGNVGINTTSPQAKLDVSNGNVFIATDNYGINFYGGAKIYKKSGSGLKIKSHNTTAGIEFLKPDETSQMIIKNGNEYNYNSKK